MNVLLRILPLGAALLLGCSHQPKAFEDMTTAEQLSLNRSQAAAAVQEACTNAVPGIHAFVDLHIDFSSPAIVNWRAVPVFDFINHQGGIDRSNLHLKFIRGSSTGRIISLEDSEYYNAQWQAHIDSILRRTNQ